MALSRQTTLRTSDTRGFCRSLSGLGSLLPYHPSTTPKGGRGQGRRSKEGTRGTPRRGVSPLSPTLSPSPLPCPLVVPFFENFPFFNNLLRGQLVPSSCPLCPQEGTRALSRRPPPCPLLSTGFPQVIHKLLLGLDHHGGHRFRLRNDPSVTAPLDDFSVQQVADQPALVARLHGCLGRCLRHPVILD